MIDDDSNELIPFEGGDGDADANTGTTIQTTRKASPSSKTNKASSSSATPVP